MRIVSLQPSVTVTLAALGVLDQVVACTRHCNDLCPEAVQDGRAIVEESWTANAEQIVALRPELVIASVPYKTESVAEILRTGAPVLMLAPGSLADIYGDISMIAGLVDRRAAGEKMIGEMEEEIAQTRKVTDGIPMQRVYCEEWGKPLMASERWVAEMVEAAGGVALGTPGAQTTAEAMAAMNPEVVLAAWCGAGDRVPLRKLKERAGWAETAAVRDGRVYCVADELFNTPAHTLMGGLRAIRWALHPELFPRPVGIRGIEDEAAIG